MKRCVVLCCVLGLGLASCALPSLQLSKKIISHERPDLMMEETYFADLGCFTSVDCLPDDLQNLDAPIGMISEPDELLGGLEPALPLAVASTVRFAPEEAFQAVYVNRCLAQQYIRYLIKQEDGVHLIDSVDGLAQFYAPIDSPEEALSYAMAATGYSAIYDLNEGPNRKQYLTPLEETFVKSVDGGFVVHLFDAYLCGCGPHIVSNVDVTVLKDGSVSQADPVQAFSDPKLDGLCID